MRTLREAARAVRDGETTSIQLVEAAADRAERWSVLNAFSQLRIDEALAEARGRDEALERTHRTAHDRGGSGRDRPGPLHGVPVAVKDLFDVAGWETTGCSQTYRRHVAERDAALVARLRDAGAVIVGKTNQHELAAGGTNLVSACGVARNPWDPGRITGGSSGGSAAATAARIVPMALGSDTGGSIRIPASLCGVAGLKPAQGRLDATGMMPLAPGMDCPGPLAPEVADVALVFAVLAGREPSPVAEGADGLRVARLGGFFAERLLPRVTAAAGEAADALSSAGALLEDIVVEDIEDAPEVWVDLAWTQFAEAHGTLLRRPDVLYRDTRRALELGMATTGIGYLRRDRRAREIAAAFRAALRRRDALLAPATPFPAPPVDARDVRVGDGEVHELRSGVSWFTRVVNLTGLAALSVPAGFTDEGLPLGVQLIGRDEETLLRLGIALQEATGYHQREPEPPGE